MTKIAKSRTVRQRVYLSHPGVPGGHTWWLESSGALLARGGSILAKSLFLAVVLNVFTGKSNGKAKMAKNGIYMSHTRPSEYFGGSYLVVGDGSHPLSLQGVEFGPKYAFTGKKRDFTAKK